MKITHIISVGIAIFAMLFGAGNIVYPLTLGRASGETVFFAMIGFFLTAVILPIIGLISALVCNGDYKKLFDKLGPVTGNAVIFFCMMLFGPFAIVPRCVTIAYASVQWYIPFCSLTMFSVFASLLIFIATYRPTGVITLLGRFLGPLKLILLFSIVFFGLWSWEPLMPSSRLPIESFSDGLLEGFWTLDLLGTIFFSTMILYALRKKINLETPKQLAMAGLQSGAIGGLVLGIIYAGFCLISAMHSGSIGSVPDVQILTALSTYLLGAKAGAVANITVAISCLTTAIALTTVFADYVQKEVLKQKVSYTVALIGTVIMAAIMANLGFAKIMGLIAPVVLCLYPALVVLSIANILDVLCGFRFIKIPFWVTLIVTIVLKYR
jgi:LIVCS family branched-chain amino acid:cation transporter